MTIGISEVEVGIVDSSAELLTGGISRKPQLLPDVRFAQLSKAGNRLINSGRAVSVPNLIDHNAEDVFSPAHHLPYHFQELSREEVFRFRCLNYRSVGSCIHIVVVTGDGSKERQVASDDDRPIDVGTGQAATGRRSGTCR